MGNNIPADCYAVAAKVIHKPSAKILKLVVGKAQHHARQSVPQVPVREKDGR